MVLRSTLNSQSAQSDFLLPCEQLFWSQGQKAKQEVGQTKKDDPQAVQGGHQGKEKPKTTKAERRAKQEAERAAKVLYLFLTCMCFVAVGTVCAHASTVLYLLANLPAS